MTKRNELLELAAFHSNEAFKAWNEGRKEDAYYHGGLSEEYEARLEGRIEAQHEADADERWERV